MKSSYIKIFICALIAAGVACVIAGIIIFFVTESTEKLVGMIFIAVGVLDSIISLFALLLYIIKDKSDRKEPENNNNHSEEK